MLRQTLSILKTAVFQGKHPNNANILRNPIKKFRLPTVWFSRMGDSQSVVTDLPESNSVERKDKVRLTDEEWKKRLSSEQFQVCRKRGTESAWVGDLLDNKQKGVYSCSACGFELFNSSTKFDSGSGWPSFFDTIKDKTTNISNVEVHTDTSHGMTRTEVLCGKCDSHLGHVFNDGPQPTSLRFCINSISIKFKPGDSGRNSSM